MLKRIRRYFARFRREESGNVAMIFALSALPLMALAGGAIDMARMFEAKARLQTALDSATLAASNTGETDEEVLRNIMEKYIRSNYKNSKALQFNLEDDLSIDIEKNNGKYILHAEIRVKYNPLFLSFVMGNVTRATVSAEARYGYGGFEIALVLDNTGSMEGEKMEELKEAAQSMISGIAEAARENEMERAHIGLVPYNVYVNVGRDKLFADWLDTSNIGWRTWRWPGTVGMRSEPRDVTDEDYDVEGIPAVLNYFWFEDGGYWAQPSVCVWRTRRGCREWQPALIPRIEPLRDVTDEDNEETLNTAIQGMIPFSGTNIPLGLVWGWRLLTPNAPYTEAMDMQQAREKNVRKVIVLMTDGWNSCFSENRSGYVTCRAGMGPVAPEADERMRQLCTNIKESGIGIVTVGYDVPEGSSTEELLEECQNMGYYRAEIGELVDIFEQIANDITSLHLSG